MKHEELTARGRAPAVFGGGAPRPRLWEALETIRDGFAIWSPELRLVAANRAFLSIFDGLDPVRPGVSLAETMALMAEEGIVDTGGAPSADWARGMSDRVAAARIEPVTIALWNGQHIRLVDRRTPSGDLVTLALDMSEQVAREAELTRASERAEAGNRAKLAFLASMSHEIRTPMSGVIGTADLLAETELTEVQRAYVETMRSSGEALLVIINDLLDFSKIEAEKIELRADPFDLEKCIHDVVTLLLPAARSKGLDTLIDYDLSLPTGFVGDAGRIRQVLTNLVGNAIKFTDKGRVTVRATGAGHAADEACGVRITVEDTGIGIPAARLDDVFDEFQQVESDMDRRHDGTGLGLAISRRLVALMGGKIWAASDEGAGSTFGVEIALVPAAPSEEPVTAPPWLARAIVLDARSGARDVIARQLAAIGLRPEVTDDPGALERLAPGPSDVLFVGRVPAGRAACEFGEELRRRIDPAGLFLLADGRAAPDDRDRVFDAVLHRPVLRADMARALSILRRRSRLRSRVPPILEAESALPRWLDLPPAEEVGNIFAGETGAPAARPVSRPGPVPADGLRPMLVLAAEDKPTNRFVLERMLDPLDIELVFAEDGEEAVRLFAERAPDLVFTDISMPRMDGKEAARAMRRIEAERGGVACPIVAVTAHAMDGDADAILAAGIDHYVTKPVRKSDMIEHILNAQPLGTRPVFGDEFEDDADRARRAGNVA